MNICFYTTSQPSVASLLNMGHLVHSRPAHNYSFLNVAAEHPAQTMLEKLRRKYAEVRFNDGRFDLERDLSNMQRNLAAYVHPIDMKAFRQGTADTVNDEKSLHFLNEVKPDIIIQAGAGIMKASTFTLAGIATINLHHGIMPDIRGIESTFWCLFYGIREKIGVSCHFIDEGLDTGAVIAQAPLESNAKTFVDLQTENYLMGRQVLVQSIDVLERGNFAIRSEGMIPSYYFGNVNPFLYYALKKRGFAPLMKIADKAYKMKEKKVVTPV